MDNLSIRFWGVRGSIPVPQEGFLKVGGNTACLELTAGTQSIIIDGGSGIRSLGNSLANRQPASEPVPILFTHFHWDHIQGLPFLGPLYRQGGSVAFYSTVPEEKLGVILQNQMSSPYFPIALEAVPARIEVHQIGSHQNLGALSVDSFPLHHPQGASGFRFQFAGKTIVHASDTEHGHAASDRILREYTENADLLIYDAQYTPDEYEARRGWGHSTWLEGTRIANECNIRALCLFHHDPGHSDVALEQIEHEARCKFENTTVAREGSEIQL